jgi:hypothetical protein
VSAAGSRRGIGGGGGGGGGSPVASQPARQGGESANQQVVPAAVGRRVCFAGCRNNLPVNKSTTARPSLAPANNQRHATIGLGMVWF